ncbi:unnamed protein product [Rotaria sp. Silwood1]|nr:unnamed protein product [Rotaria sp. Silwood1]
MLIESIRCFQIGNDLIQNNPNVLLLVDPIIKCLCSSTYINILKQIDIKSNDPNAFEDFILGTCPYNILITTYYSSETNLTNSAILFIFNLTHDFEIAMNNLCHRFLDIPIAHLLATLKEIVCSLTFNKHIYDILIHNYENFFIYLKNILIHSKEEGVQAASKGILS